MHRDAASENVWKRSPEKDSYLVPGEQKTRDRTTSSAYKARIFLLPASFRTLRSYLRHSLPPPQALSDEANGSEYMRAD